MSKQIQVKRPAPKRPDEPADAPTVNVKITRLWFSSEGK